MNVLNENFFFKFVRKINNTMSTNMTTTISKSNSIDLSDPLTFYDVITNVRDDKY